MDETKQAILDGLVEDTLEDLAYPVDAVDRPEGIEFTVEEVLLASLKKLREIK